MEILFEYLFRMIQERLGQVLDMPAASITEDVVDHPRLVEQLTGPHHELLRELFDACNHARYAPESDHRKLVEFSSNAGIAGGFTLERRVTHEANALQMVGRLCCCRFKIRPHDATLFFGWWGNFSPSRFPDLSNAPSEKSQLANSPEKVDPVKQEYETLLIMDEDAMDEIDAWIRQAGEESLQQQDGSSITCRPH